MSPVQVCAMVVVTGETVEHEPGVERGLLTGKPGQQSWGGTYLGGNCELGTGAAVAVGAWWVKPMTAS
jgi:hypothetical protein